MKLKEKYKNLSVSTKILFIFKLSAIAVSFLFFIALIFVKMDSGASEYWTRNWTFRWVGFWGSISSVFPFSVFELICFVLAIFAVVWLVLLIIDFVKKRTFKATNKLLSIVCIAVVMIGCYNSVATVAYNRHPLDLKSVSNEQIEANASKSLDNYFEEYISAIKGVEVAEDGTSKCPYTFEQLGEKLIKEYEALDSDYFPNYISKPKKITSSWIMSNFWIQGITFVPTGEGNVNAFVPDTAKTFTMAHEMAHVMGVMRESEANILAKYILLNSKDPYLRYVGFLNCNEMNSVAVYTKNGKKYSDFEEKNKELLSVIEADFSKEIDFWNKYNIFDDIGDFFNNIYLKLQGEKEGTDSYNSPSDIETGIDDNGEIVYIVKDFSQSIKVIFSIFDYQ